MGLLQWLGLAANGESLPVGAQAPDAASRDEQGRAVRLADFYGEGFTLIYFYPKADTPGCTAQACSLRDDFQELRDRGVRVVGVSSDGPAVQMKFKEKYRLPFTLLADEEGSIARAFGVRLILGMPHRQAFLIKGGKVVWRDLSASTKDQAKDVLRIVA